MALVPNAMLICLSSVYARRGECWRTYEQYFGNDGAQDILVLNAATHVMNPTISQRTIAAAYEQDLIAAATEFGAEFRRDIESFLPVEALEAVRMHGRLELPWAPGLSYVAFCDPAGGTGDSFTLAIAHGDRRGVVLDLVREIRPPFSPDAAVEQLAAILKAYHVDAVTSDRYAGAWTVERWAAHGIRCVPSELTKSELYLAALPLVTSRRVELLDQPTLLKQLRHLERRTARGGRDSVDHLPGPNHDDVSNSACGALWLASQHEELNAEFLEQVLAIGSHDEELIQLNRLL